MMTDFIESIIDLTKVRIKFSEEDEVFADLSSTSAEADCLTRCYSADRVDKCEIRTVKDGDNVVFYADMVASDHFYRYRGACLSVSFENADKVLAYYHNNPWDMICSFPKTSKDLIKGTQSFVIEKDGLHYCFLQLCGENFRSEADDGEIFIDSRYESKDFKGAFLAVSVANNPYDAFQRAYDCAHKCGVLVTPDVKTKTFPKVFEGIGYCTWNAFYKNVTSKDIYAKLDEFREKGVKINWLLIDDGWLNENGEALLTFEANPNKFPEGLKKCVAKIKGEYGVKYVGLWHTFQGHWRGVDVNGEIWKDYSDCFIMSRNGCYVPSDDEEKAFRFWDAFHSFLAACGIDFVKTDNQSSLNGYIEGIMPTTPYARVAHRALERSTVKNFYNALLNCMGMDIEEIQNRPFSALTRNSDDFFPDRENGFAKHLVQNVYNTVIYSPLYWCDFDMFWSGKSDPIRSGVLRAISGATIYMSDALGETDAEKIVAICGKDYEFNRFDGAAKPTLDTVYADCLVSGAFVKTFNYKGDDTSLAVYNITKEEKTETVSLCAVPTLKDGVEYVMFEHFSKEYRKVTNKDSVTLKLSAEGVAAYSFMPVLDGEYILIGDTEMYFPPMSIEKKKVYLKDLEV